MGGGHRARSKCFGRFYLYKLDYRRFISMPFSISLDAPADFTCINWTTVV
eukprot:COSAG01_NODE_9544_length_2414_cov_1.990497_3_plen_49_part_01